MKTRTIVIILALLFTLGAGGCADDAAEPAQRGLSVTASALCGASPNGDEAFPTPSQKVVLRVSGGALDLEENPEDRVVQRAFAGLDDDGAARIDELPFGAGMTVEVVTCDANDDPVWAGVSAPFEIVEEEPETTVVIVLSQLEEFVATGMCGPTGDAPVQPNPINGRAFAGLIGADDGIWMLGGFDEITAEGGSKKNLSATTVAVERYDRARSTFEAQGALAAPRAMALVQSAGANAVRLVGGVLSVTAGSPNGEPSLFATDGPSKGIEFYDVSTGASVGTVDIVFPALPGVVALDDGRAVVVGGRDLSDPLSPLYSDKAWIVPAGQPAAADIEETEPLGSPRYGATVVAAGVGALVWGGAMEEPAAAKPLWINADDGTVVALAGSDAVAQTLFGAGAYLGEEAGRHRFIVLGGATIGDDGKSAPSVNEAHGVLVEVDQTGASFTSTDLVFTESAVQLQRAGASLFGLSDGSLWFVGGYQSFGNSDGVVCGEAGPPCLPGQTLRFEVGADATVTATALDLPARSDLHIGAFGSMAARLETDGSWLVTPGYGVDTETGSITLTGESALVRFEVAESELCQVPVAP